LNERRTEIQPHKATSIDDQALEYIKKNGATSVPNLWEALRFKNPELTDAEMVDLVWRLEDSGNVDLQDIPLEGCSIGEYLQKWERNLWIYTALVASLATVMVISLPLSIFPLVVLRWVLGSMFVLFIPGYLAVEALFPNRQELDGLERLALSVGLSLALIPLVGLLLNYTPWGIRLTPIVISLSLLTIGLAVTALYRHFTIAIAGIIPTEKVS
jgi:hypothetical protein